jgi:hypothetical protein
LFDFAINEFITPLIESSVALSFTSFLSFSLERINDSSNVAPSGIFELIAFKVSKNAA